MIHQAAMLPSAMPASSSGVLGRPKILFLCGAAIQLGHEAAICDCNLLTKTLTLVEYAI